MYQEKDIVWCSRNPKKITVHNFSSVLVNLTWNKKKKMFMSTKYFYYIPIYNQRSEKSNRESIFFLQLASLFTIKKLFVSLIFSLTKSKKEPQQKRIKLTYSRNKCSSWISIQLIMSFLKNRTYCFSCTRQSTKYSRWL